MPSNLRDSLFAKLAMNPVQAKGFLSGLGKSNSTLPKVRGVGQQASGPKIDNFGPMLERSEPKVMPNQSMDAMGADAVLNKIRASQG